MSVPTRPKAKVPGGSSCSSSSGRGENTAAPSTRGSENREVRKAHSRTLGELGARAFDSVPGLGNQAAEDHTMALSWYALSVHARQERAAEAGLKDRDFHVFLPTRLERRIWSDRIKSLEMALFPGYLFVRTFLDGDKRLEMLKIKQVKDLVGRLMNDTRVARSIPDHEIESLRTVLMAERDMDPVVGLVKGTEVLIGQGPLRGARGIVAEEPDGKRRLIVQISLLGRGVRALLQADDLLVEGVSP